MGYAYTQTMDSDAAAANTGLQTFYAHDDGTLLGAGGTNTNCCAEISGCSTVENAGADGL